MTTTAAPELAREEPPTEDPPPRAPRRWPTVAGLLLCVGLLLFAALRVAVHDPTELQVSGDQAPFVLQAISIADGNLSFDARDHERWLELGWESQPRGLFLQRNGDDGWAFAKPYGYSLLLAPAIEAFDADGISYVGALLLLGYAWLWYAIGRTRWRPLPAAMVATTATMVSNAWPMSFPAHADVFVAVVVGTAVLAAVRMVVGPPVERTTGEAAPRSSPLWAWWWPSLAMFATAVLVTEKMPALVAVGPLVALALWRSPLRSRILAMSLGVVVVAVSMVPYVHYSDGLTWNAYGGNRFYAPGALPWSGGSEENLLVWQTSEDMSPRRVVDRIVNPDGDIPAATLTYVIGRHTGAVTNQAVIAPLTLATGAAVWRRRRARSREGDDDPADDATEAGREDGSDPQRPWSTWALAAAGLGIVGYASLYLVSFTDNYFGGGQSVGNRYFLQISVLVAVIPVAGRISERAAGWSAVVGAALGFTLIAPHIVGADDAFFHIERTSWLQDQLPFESTQDAAWRLQCDPDVDCFPRPLPPAVGE